MKRYCVKSLISGILLGSKCKHFIGLHLYYDIARRTYEKPNLPKFVCGVFCHARCPAADEGLPPKSLCCRSSTCRKWCVGETPSSPLILLNELPRFVKAEDLPKAGGWKDETRIPLAAWPRLAWSPLQRPPQCSSMALSVRAASFRKTLPWSILQRENSLKEHGAEAATRDPILSTSLLDDASERGSCVRKLGARWGDGKDVHVQWPAGCLSACAGFNGQVIGNRVRLFTSSSKGVPPARTQLRDWEMTAKSHLLGPQVDKQYIMASQMQREQLQCFTQSPHPCALTLATTSWEEMQSSEAKKRSHHKLRPARWLLLLRGHGAGFPKRKMAWAWRR